MTTHPVNGRLDSATYDKGTRMKAPSTRTIDIRYAVSVLLAAGAVVQHVDCTAPWRVSTDDGRTFQVSNDALVELAYDEARRRRDDWQGTVDAINQARLFEPVTTGAITA